MHVEPQALQEDLAHGMHLRCAAACDDDDDDDDDDTLLHLSRRSFDNILSSPE